MGNFVAVFAPVFEDAVFEGFAVLEALDVFSDFALAFADGAAAASFTDVFAPAALAGVAFALGVLEAGVLPAPAFAGFLAALPLAALLLLAAAVLADFATESSLDPDLVVRLILPAFRRILTSTAEFLVLFLQSIYGDNRQTRKSCRKGISTEIFS